MADEFDGDLLLSVLIVLCGAALLICERRKWREFNDRYPPISDEEFLQRCSPGVRPEIALKVRRIVSDAYDIDYERIHPESNLVELGNS